ncbi:MAG: YraN family protein [Candidatus Cloacimonetes bacterium 4572_65]|nr:MAG: YraN family protein [Candidatus Cloacimonetes bacterium 4572_65]
MEKNYKRRKFAEFGESLARKYLISKGYTIITHNYSCYYGEIDIVAKVKDCLVIIEVKSRSKLSTDETLLAVTKKKRERITKTTVDFIATNPSYDDFYKRFDIITVTKHKLTGEFVVHHYEDAFDPVF